MRLLLSLLFFVIAGGAHGQGRLPVQEARLPGLATVDLVRLAGLTEPVFRALFDAEETAVFHHGPRHDVTFRVAPEGLLTIHFYDGKAGRFRLVSRHPHPTPEALAHLLGLAPDGLTLTESLDVKRVWVGTLDGVVFESVTAVFGPVGWQMIEVRVAGYPHE